MSRLLVIPDRARRPEMLINDDGSLTARWFDPCCDDASHGDFWLVTLSADGLAVDMRVEHGDGYEADTPNVFDTARDVLQYQSGVEVKLSIVQRG